MSELAIRTDYWTPRGDEYGTLKYCGQQPIGEVKQQILDVLEKIEGDNIHEWIYINMPGCESYNDAERAAALAKPMPKGEILVSVTQGNNEGYQIRLFVEDDDHEIIRFAQLKYLTAQDEVFEIGKELSIACVNGQFGYTRPPEGAES